MQYTITLPFPISVNHYWSHRVIGRRVCTYLTDAGRAFKDLVTKAVVLCGGQLGLTQELAVKVILHAPDGRRRDIDNFGGKALLDALTSAGVWKDDSQVKDLHLTWGHNVPKGSCEVTIKEFKDASC